MRLGKILVATDFSDASRAAGRRAAQIAIAGRAELILVHAYDPGRPGASVAERGAAEEVAREHNAIGVLIEQARAELAAAGASVRALRVDGPAAGVLLEVARAQGVDLLVVGSHGRTGLRRLLLGSVAERVVRESAAPVLVARGEVGRGFHRVLVGSDLGPESERALDAAVTLAAPAALVEVLHVLPLPVPSVALLRGREEDVRAAGAALVGRHRREGLEVLFSCEVGDARGELLRRAAAQRRDLLAVGSHGRGPLARAALGAVSDAVVRGASCSVLVAH
jgi:nucleotide-binding universal stress UspA family protein